MARVRPVNWTLDHELVGTTPPEWTADAWVNSPPLRLADLRGRVVLVRWFMGASCPLCSATAPSLRALSEELGPRGLTVIALYHHRDGTPLDDESHVRAARTLGFAFPVARDPDAKTLRAWWLDGHERAYTSVSFLLDKRGRIRGVHEGGRYAPGEPAFQAIRSGILRLLDEGDTS
jgi:peroxiredoxin